MTYIIDDYIVMTNNKIIKFQKKKQLVLIGRRRYYVVLIFLSLVFLTGFSFYTFLSLQSDSLLFLSYIPNDVPNETEISSSSSNSSSNNSNNNNNNKNRFSSNHNNKTKKKAPPYIRSWGCDRSDYSPFIFVHIGKAGGGYIRARIAASSVNYTRGNKWMKAQDGKDGSYYPFPTTTTTTTMTTMAAAASAATDTVMLNTTTTTSSSSIPTNNNQRRAMFCNSYFPHHRPLLQKDYEGVWVCNATTPIGQMIGCPIRWHHRVNECYCNPKSTYCDLVYVGHNFVGSELHWLPGPYLEEWWTKLNSDNNNNHNDKTYNNITAIVTNTDDDTAISTTEENRKQATLQIAINLKHISNGSVQRIKPANPQCFTNDDKGQNNKEAIKQRIIPHRIPIYEFDNSNCTGPFVTLGDRAGRIWLQGRQNMQQRTIQRQEKQSQTNNKGTYVIDIEESNNDYTSFGEEEEEEDWSSLYASLPVARVTLLRDPFSWLVSKFFWHNIHDKQSRPCDDIKFATKGAGQIQQHQLDILHWTSKKTLYKGGWIVHYCLVFILYLCGEDCVSRLHYGTITSLNELQVQTENNLRTSFIVVGILNETNIFLNMISKRISYIDTTLNPTIVGNKHKAKQTKEYLRCKEQFVMNHTLQELLLNKSPELRIVKHLYNVAIEVNRFQQNELLQC